MNVQSESTNSTGGEASASTASLTTTTKEEIIKLLDKCHDPSLLLAIRALAKSNNVTSAAADVPSQPVAADASAVNTSLHDVSLLFGSPPIIRRTSASKVTPATAAKQHEPSHEAISTFGEVSGPPTATQLASTGHNKPYGTDGTILYGPEERTYFDRLGEVLEKEEVRNGAHYLLSLSSGADEPANENYSANEDVSNCPNQDIAPNVDAIDVEGILQQGIKRHKRNEKETTLRPSEVWYNGLSKAEKEQIKKGTDAILYAGCMKAARCYFEGLYLEDFLDTNLGPDSLGSEPDGREETENEADETDNDRANCLAAALRKKGGSPFDWRSFGFQCLVCYNSVPTNVSFLHGPLENTEDIGDGISSNEDRFSDNDDNDEEVTFDNYHDKDDEDEMADKELVERDGQIAEKEQLAEYEQAAWDGNSYKDTEITENDELICENEQQEEDAAAALFEKDGVTPSTRKRKRSLPGRHGGRSHVATRSSVVAGMVEASQAAQEEEEAQATADAYNDTEGTNRMTRAERATKRANARIERDAQLARLLPESEQDSSDEPPTRRRRVTPETVIEVDWIQHEGGGKKYGFRGRVIYLEKSSKSATTFKLGKSEKFDTRAQTGQTQQPYHGFYKPISVGLWIKTSDLLSKLDIFLLLFGRIVGWKRDSNGNDIEREHFAYSVENEAKLLDVLKRLLYNRNALIEFDGDIQPICMDEDSIYYYKKHPEWKAFVTDRFHGGKGKTATASDEILSWDWDDVVRRISRWKVEREYSLRGSLPSSTTLHGRWLTCQRENWRNGNLNEAQVEKLKSLGLLTERGNKSKRSFNERLVDIDNWLKDNPLRHDGSVSLPSARSSNPKIRDIANYINWVRSRFLGNQTYLPNNEVRALDDRGFLGDFSHYFCVCGEVHSEPFHIQCNDCRRWYPVDPVCIGCQSEKDAQEEDFKWTCKICTLPESERALKFTQLLVKEDVAQGRQHVLSLIRYRMRQILIHHFNITSIYAWDTKATKEELASLMSKEDTLYSCPACDKTNLTKNGLRTHYGMKHGGSVDMATVKTCRPASKKK